MVRSGTPMIATAIAPQEQVCGETTNMRGSGACRAKGLGADGHVRPWRPGIRQRRTSIRPPDRVTGGGPARSVTGERDGPREPGANAGDATRRAMPPLVA